MRSRRSLTALIEQITNPKQNVISNNAAVVRRPRRGKEERAVQVSGGEHRQTEALARTDRPIDGTAPAPQMPEVSESLRDWLAELAEVQVRAAFEALGLDPVDNFDLFQGFDELGHAPFPPLKHFSPSVRRNYQPPSIPSIKNRFGLPWLIFPAYVK
jgi:hypothetical protein